MHAAIDASFLKAVQSVLVHAHTIREQDMKKEPSRYTYSAFERADKATRRELETLRAVVKEMTKSDSHAPKSGRSKIATKPKGQTVHARLARSSR